MVIQIFDVLDGEAHGKTLPSPRPRRLCGSGGPDVTICLAFSLPCIFPCLCRVPFFYRVLFLVFAVVHFVAVSPLLFCRALLLCRAPFFFVARERCLCRAKVHGKALTHGSDDFSCSDPPLPPPLPKPPRLHGHWMCADRQRRTSSSAQALSLMVARRP